VAAVALAVAAATGWHGANRLSDIRRIKVAEAKAWDIRGPACPAITRDAYIEGRGKRSRGFDYQDVGFHRRSGYADCAAIYEDGGLSDRSFPVCQFTSPGQLLVRTGSGEWFFEPGPGQPATVSLRGGVARCVMAAKVTLATVRAARAAKPQ
jgi:hypothetical protein